MRPRAALAVALCAGVAACGGGGSEEDDVRAAYERVAEAFRSGDSATWCDTVVSDALLPDAVLRHIPVEAGNAGSLSELDALRRECRASRPLDNVPAREREQTPVDAPDEVRILDVQPAGGVERVAILGRGEDAAPLVRVDRDWLLVFDSN